MTQPPTGPDQPQQPEQPGQDPQGTPPPPPPYGAPQQPPQPPSGGSYPAPGDTPPQYGSTPYGQPPSPYGAPQQPYGAPGAFPGGGQQGEPSKGMAIGALVSSVLCCLPVGLVLGIVVLRRSRDGRDHGKGLAIAAIVLNTLVMIGALVLVVVAVVFGSSLRAVSDLEVGDCVSGSGMREESEAEVETLRVQECTEPHDGEVLGVAVLTAEDIAADQDDFTSLCSEIVAGDPERSALFGSSEYILLALREGEEVGDSVACLALDSDGDELTEPLVE